MRRNMSLWVLYDFANSIVSVVFFLYFAQWVVVDMRVADIFFNMTFTASAVMLLFAVPTYGVWLDRGLSRLTGLRWTTAFTALFYATTCVVALQGERHVGLALVLFTLGLFAYLLSFTFYTPLISQVSTKENLGRISGYGIAANYAGQFAGLILVLPFSSGKLSLFGGLPRVEVLLPAIVIFFLLSLPMLLWFKEIRMETVTAQDDSMRGRARQPLIREAWLKVKRLSGAHAVSVFLLSYFLFNDAILTASNNFPIFLQQVWGVSDTVKTYMALGVLTTSGIGGFFAGHISDRLGHLRVLVYILLGWVFILPAIGFLTSFILFVVAIVLMGFWFGATWTVSRSVMADLAPKDQYNFAFGCFNLVERVSSLLGPLVWGLVVNVLFTEGVLRYRLAAFSMTAFTLLGLVVLIRAKKLKAMTEE